MPEIKCSFIHSLLAAPSRMQLLHCHSRLSPPLSNTKRSREMVHKRTDRNGDRKARIEANVVPQPQRDDAQEEMDTQEA